jgi:hypothetical protein
MYAFWMLTLLPEFWIATGSPLACENALSLMKLPPLTVFVALLS